MKNFNHNKIKELRKTNKMSQKQLGEYMGISDRAVSKWETGISSPSGQNLINMAKIFSVSVESFFYDDISKNKNCRKGMESIKELYKVGRGPSSSHSIGPERACTIFKKLHGDADSFKAVLFGSLAKTGRGHGTDNVIKKTFLPFKCDVSFDCITNDIPHPNTMDLIALKNGREICKSRVLSIGGGSIIFKNQEYKPPKRIYKLSKFSDISDYCKNKNIRLYEYALENEEKDFYDYMMKIWNTMKLCIKKGLEDYGELPGGLKIQKKAKMLLNNQHIDETAETKENRMVCAYAFAVGEQNACGETIVTAPTCGASGVVPAVLYYQQQKNNYTDERMVRALITAGIVGNLIKSNASVSGA